MSWKMYRWIWRLEAPLHIGMYPAGMLNRTRLYVPARTLWGALTAELARRKKDSFPDYLKEGENLRQKTRLSYLFPAQPVNEKWQAWLPQYEEGQGFLWKREDEGKSAADREFRRWLLGTRPGTAIDPNSDTAAEGTLREHEVINPWSCWGERGSPQPVALVGYIFLSKDTEEILDLDELFLGGDTRYGLGRIKRIEYSEDESFFGEEVRLEKHPVVMTKFLRAHVFSPTEVALSGALERLAMWNHQEFESLDRVAWVPGSKPSPDKKSSPEILSWVIREDGFWMQQK
ncbi:hypothetical protein FVE67_00110 [Thermosulfurimonas marina]|uniref:CRISPR-associated protein n=1 Tax=Thermosulfurimonas marina TaxID=2047767 RepID=A0A6H1WQ73_9BACT|nr:hypothetical protein [Thermosulfurimonas marina]QJA05286.1 hypothetical protein FVE67_00110 [Thermosulfurimonas marina]